MNLEQTWISRREALTGLTLAVIYMETQGSYLTRNHSDSAEKHNDAPRGGSNKYPVAVDESGVPNRDVVSQEPMEIYVDPAEGDDSNPGTELDPIETLQEALNRLPYIIVHLAKIHLAEGDYAEDPQVINSGIHLVSFKRWSDEEQFPLIIQGDPENPENVRLSEIGWTNIAINGHVPYRTVIEGIQFDGKVQNYSGVISIRNCRFTGQNVDTDQNAIDGYNGYTLVENCWFGDQVNTAMYANQSHQIQVSNCTGSVETVYETNTFGEVAYAETNDIDGATPE